MTSDQLTVVAFVGMLVAMAWQSATVLIRAWQGRQG
jgi:hypothetical protein